MAFATASPGRSSTGWTVSYAMYHPSWLYDDQAGLGVESYVLVNAAAGLYCFSQSMLLTPTKEQTRPMATMKIGRLMK